MAYVDHGGHRQRMKARFLEEGLGSFSAHQALELTLFYGVPQKDTNETAHRLLTRYGSISGVFNADYAELSCEPGVGPHAALLLKLIPELTRLYMKDRWKERPKITDTKMAGQFASTLFIGAEREEFYMICLDTQNRVIMPVLVGSGTLNEAMVYPRLVIEHALRHNSAAVILSHNHPGGSTEPSLPDIELTKKLKAALAVISVKVADHIIVSGEKYLSLAERRLV